MTNRNYTKLYYVFVTLFLIGVCLSLRAKQHANNTELFNNKSITPPDSGLIVPIPVPNTNPLNENSHQSPFILRTPPGLETQIIYNPETNTYEFQNKTGDVSFGPGAYMNINEYIGYDLQNQIKNYWRSQGAHYNGDPNRRGSGLIPSLRIGNEVFESIFGGNTIEIRPAGSAELIFGITHTNTKNNSLPIKQRRITRFNFDQNIQLNAMAKIGEKIDFNLNYNTKADFNFDNKMKLAYNGKEDDIIQLLEFGDVTLPLNSSLIVGSQSLFGLKTQLKFGKLMITAVASNQKGDKKSITVEGGGQTSQFYFRADEYEENKHFFIGQYFYEHYNQYLSTLPLVNSPIIISKIEVWRTTIGAALENNRNIVAFTDLGENRPSMSIILPNGDIIYPDNRSNNLYQVADSSIVRDLNQVSNSLRARGFTAGKDFEKIENARLLNTSEYTFNSKLGFISLNQALTADQVLAVAFQYQVIGDDKVYQVGEFSSEVSSPNCLRVKLLKSTNLNVRSPLWKLMMKNVYSLMTYQIAPKDFRLNILYTGDAEGIGNGFFTTGEKKGIPIIRLMHLDNLNQQLDPFPDGIFDFIDGAATQGGTMNATNGRIYFPTIEPFGKDLRTVLDKESGEKYAFDSLYTMTKSTAQQFTSRNKYYLEGQYKSAYGSEYHLNAMNVAPGSVKVTAGSIQLVENQDYTVNYDMGTVSITNEGILNSGTPINITVEDQNGFGLQKRMFGVNLEYAFNKDFTLGATLLNLSERPYTPKVNFGDEPINNTIWGMNVAYKTQLPWLTKAVDFLPFFSTTAMSKLQFEGEFAHFIPGNPRAITKEGISYIDDFESSKSTIDLKAMNYWVLASTPQGQPNLFPETANLLPDAPDRRKLAYGFNRARLAWYFIDQIFYNNNSATPSNITKSDQSKPYSRAVYESELFPYKERDNAAVSGLMSVLNLAFYPSERGPYNFDVFGNEGFSAGLNENGSLRNPATRWGGIMRRMEYTDFESLNYEYIEFWMMDPFIENHNHRGGKLCFNLGDISEDILRDGLKFFENGLPADGSDENVEYTVWGRVPTIQNIVSAFENQAGARANQDVGYDGLTNEMEKNHYASNYLDLIQQRLSNEAFMVIYNDPSGDNYHYFRGSDYDAADVKINDRYKYYNNSEGNSPTEDMNPERYPISATNIPNQEDVNNDNTLSEDEKYYQYEIDLSPENMHVGSNYIVDMYEAIPEPLPDGSKPKTKWYQFRVPIKSPDKVVGDISGYNSIRFMRMFLRGFEEPVICRFATLELVKSDWRTYDLSLWEDGPYVPNQNDGETSFSVASISLEENGNRSPIPYVLPPGIEREQNYNGMQMSQINEKALSLKAVNLNDGDARAIYKRTDFDLRKYKRLQMFIHAEDVNYSGDLNAGDISVFIRLGSDFTDNYYEYEIPVQITPWNAKKDTAAIWPRFNRLEVMLDSLVSAKQQRNREVRSGSFRGNNYPYTIMLPDKHKITVIGMPNLSDVSTIMIGIRNPKKKTLNDGDDMAAKSVEVWVNELRLLGFNDKTGFAALARARVNLADLGDVALSGTFQTPGFGSLEQSVTERSQVTVYALDVATNLEGGKLLFPQKWNIKIPFHYDYSINMSAPEYNPLNPDVKLKTDLKEYEKKARDSIRRMTTAMIQRQNVNLMNVRKERNLDGPIKIRPWDVENLDFSYSYAEVKSRDVDVEFDNKYRHEGQIGYTLNHNSKNIRPLQKAKFLKSKWLQIIRDFNFTPLPKAFTFRTSVIRELNEFKLRPKSQGNILIDTSYVKSFDWTRNYTLNWDLTQGLRFDYTANAAARIEEPQGLIDTRAKKDSVWRSFGQGGRTTQFGQRFNATYQIPINKIPAFKFINAQVRYAGTFDYNAPPLSLAYLGGTIQNSSNISGNVNLNFVTLYNTSSYLKRMNQSIKPKVAKEDEKKKKELGKVPQTKSADNRNSSEEEESAENTKNKKEKEKKHIGKWIGNGTVRFLMMVRNFSVNYTQGNGTVLPGYMNTPKLLGMSLNKKGAPGFLFVFGAQPNHSNEEFRLNAGRNNWLSDSMITTAFQRNGNNSWNFRSNIEPFKDFRIDVSATRTKTEQYQDYFEYDRTLEQIKSYSARLTGNFSMSFLGLGTFFANGDELFDQFKAVRLQLAKRIAANNHADGYSPAADSTGFPSGYNMVQQDVLISSFLSTYGGRNADKVDISTPFLKIPLPNWRLNYNGFTKIKGINKIFSSLSLVHNYTSNYQIGNYTTNINYKEDHNGNAIARDLSGNFIPSKEISQIQISQNFGPFVGFDMTMVNGLTLKIEYKKRRDVALSFTNNQINENSSDEFVVNAGYRFKDIKIGFVFSGMKRQVVSDLNLLAGVGIKDNKTVLRKLAINPKDEISQVSAGLLGITINISANYQLSQMVGMRFYYDHQINRPHITGANNYDNMNFDCGIAITLMLTQ